MKVLLEYKTHHYIFDFGYSDFYCPGCGEKSVWVEDSSGDYYVGPRHVCINCDAEFHVPIFNADEGADSSRQIKAGVMDEPTTPIGN